MNKLKELRKERNLTQTELAKFLNSTQQTYQRYEIEQSEPNLDTLCKLADFYGVTLDYLIGREYNNELGYINDTEKELIKNFRQLNNLNKVKMLSEIKGFLLAQN